MTLLSKLISFISPVILFPSFKISVFTVISELMIKMFWSVFSALDAESEQIVQAALDNVVKGMLELNSFTLVSSKN